MARKKCKESIGDEMGALRIRYSVSIPILVISLVCLFFSLRFLVNYANKPAYFPSPGEPGYVIADEDRQFSRNENYANAADAFQKGDYILAISELGQEIEKFPHHAQAFFLLGYIYEQVEFPEGKYYLRMVSNYEKYIGLRPKGKKVDHAKLRVAQFYVRKGLTQQEVESLDKAEGYLKSLDQTNSEVRMALGAIYLDKQNYDQAIAAFEKSIKLPSSSSELKLKYNSLGFAYIKKGLYPQAQKYLEIAIKIDPENKFAHNNLGFVYVKQGKLNVAQIHFARALELDPSYKNAENNLRWVERLIQKGAATR